MAGTTFPCVRNVKDYGAFGDGMADDQAAIQAALDDLAPYSTLFFPPGTYLVGSQLTLATDNVTLAGPAVLKAVTSSFEYVLKAEDVTGVTVRDIEFDANRSARPSGGSQLTRYSGSAFIDSFDCAFVRCTARNTLGYSTPAAGLGIGGASERCRIDSCRLINCGTSTLLSDGVFTSGDQNVISNCIAYNCTDTAFVIESSNHSIITGCTALSCNAGAAVTNATSVDKTGNAIVGLTVKNWISSTTGGIQIGIPGSTAGNLYDTEVSGVVMYVESGTDPLGAAIVVRRNNTSDGKAIGVTISGCRINKAKTQGILIDGDDVAVVGCSIKNTVNACIQFSKGDNGYAGNNYLSGGTFGVVAGNSATVVAQSNTCIAQSSAGIGASSTSTVTSILNTILSPSGAYEAKDAGATLNLYGHRNGNLATTNITTAAVGGSQTKKLMVYDNTNTLVGTIPLYAS